MKKNAELTRREWLLLSAYLDGELSSRKKRQVEELLQSKPASREALEALRRTQQVLQYAPVRKVPRNFILTPDMLVKPLLPSFSKILSYSSAFASILLGIIFGIDMYSQSMMANQAAFRADVDEQMAPQAMMLEEEAAPAVEIQETPAIIYWGGPPYAKYAMGGGGGDAASGLGGGMGIGGGGGGGVEVPEFEIVSEAELLFGDDGGLTVESEELPQAEVYEAAPAEKQAEPEEAAAEEERQFEDLILGVRPEGQRGQITTERPLVPPREVSEIQEEAFPWRLVEWVLMGLALLTGLLAYLLGRRRK